MIDEANPLTGGAVGTDEIEAPRRDPVAILGAVVRDTGRLATQHAELLRREIRQGVGDSASAVAMAGAGAGLVAVGGVFGALALVHGLHRATRLPLWGCYGLVGAALTTAGVGLVGAGARRVASADLVPRETIAALRDDLQWIMHDETRTS